jgi:hypothetical protein
VSSINDAPTPSDTRNWPVSALQRLGANILITIVRDFDASKSVIPQQTFLSALVVQAIRPVINSLRSTQDFHQLFNIKTTLLPTFSPASLLTSTLLGYWIVCVPSASF